MFSSRLHRPAVLGPKPACPVQSERGFTIVEAIMAAIILVVGFLGMIQAITIGSEMQATARRETLAAQIINHEFEKLRFKDWSYISGLTTTSTTVTIDSQFTAAVAASGATFTLTRTLSADPYATIREVNFTVTWTVRPSGISTSRTYTRASSAWFGQYGLNMTYQRS